MGTALFRAVCRTGIFMICAQAVVHFRPHESYEKYLKLLVSVMVLIQLFLPVAGLLAGTGRQSAATQLEDFRKSLEQGMEEAGREAERADALLEKMTLEEVRRRMEEQAASASEGAPAGQISEGAQMPEGAQTSEGAQMPEGTQTSEEAQTSEGTRIPEESQVLGTQASVEIPDIKVEVEPYRGYENGEAR